MMILARVTNKPLIFIVKTRMFRNGSQSESLGCVLTGENIDPRLS